MQNDGLRDGTHFLVYPTAISCLFKYRHEPEVKYCTTKFCSEQNQTKRKRQKEEDLGDGDTTLSSRVTAMLSLIAIIPIREMSEKRMVVVEMLQKEVVYGCHLLSLIYYVIIYHFSHRLKAGSIGNGIQMGFFSINIILSG